MVKRKRMTVCEFEEYLLERKPLWVLYDSELQDRVDPASATNIQMMFSKVVIKTHPDTIYLVNRGIGSMTLPHPDYIVVENRTYYGMTIVRIVNHKYTGTDSQDVILVLLDA